MQIIIDCQIGPNGFPIGYNTFETDEVLGLKLLSPVDGKTPMKPMEYLNHLAQNEAAREQAGWNEASKLPGLPKGTTRFQALLNAAQAQTEDAELAALRILV